MKIIPSYPKIYNFGHLYVSEILKKPLLIEEKCDGSQGSVAIIEGELVFRSKGAIIQREIPPKIFAGFVDAMCDREHMLTPGWIYRGEVFQSPKHNAIAYSRIPKDHFVIFDIMVGDENYLPYEEKVKEAQRLGLEIVPKIYEGIVESSDFILNLLERESFLGGSKIEGVVCKAYGTFGIDGKTLMAKYVNEAFKEVNRKNWKSSNPTNNDIILKLAEMYRTEARWRKAVIHLKESGELENSPRDIGKLMKLCNLDILEEEEANIKEVLWDWAKGHVTRRATHGLAEWYKKLLLEISFNQDE